MVRDFRLMKTAILAGSCAASIAVLWLSAIPRDATPPVAAESPIESGRSAGPLGPSAPETAMTNANARVEPETPAAASMEPESPSPAPEWARGLNLTQDEIERMREWLRVSFEERERFVREERRDLDWAPVKEREIMEFVNGFRRPSLQLLSVDCRTTVCRIVIYEVGEKYLNGGPPIHRLRELGLDHQGPADFTDEGNAYTQVLIVRRMR